jgi:plastocyanin
MSRSLYPLWSRRVAVVAVAAAGLTAVALAGCGSTKTPSAAAASSPAAGTPATTMAPMPGMDTPATTAPAGPAVATTKVDINNFAFSPAVITVKAGTTVTWTNTDEEPHTVVSASASMRSATLAGTSNTYSHAFMTPGTYAYNCSIHPFMHGTVVVTA